MAGETIKVLLMLALFGGLQAALHLPRLLDQHALIPVRVRRFPPKG